jgi:hypothetical protein
MTAKRTVNTTGLSARRLHEVVAAVTEGGQEGTSADIRKLRTRFRGDSAHARYGHGHTGTAAGDVPSSLGTRISSAKSHERESPRMISSIPGLASLASMPGSARPVPGAGGCCGCAGGGGGDSRQGGQLGLPRPGPVAAGTTRVRGGEQPPGAGG